MNKRRVGGGGKTKQREKKGKREREGGRGGERKRSRKHPFTTSIPTRQVPIAHFTVNVPFSYKLDAFQNSN